MKFPALASIACVLALAPQPARPQTPNLVRNGDFAQVVDGRPADWQAFGARTVEQTLSVVTDGGRRCAKLACTRFSGAGGDAHAMVAQVGVVRLEQGKTYEFTCRARCENLAGRSVSVAISDTAVWDNCGLEYSLALGPQWRTYRTLFKATRSVERTSRLQFWFTETGALYLADVRITPVDMGKVEFTNAIAPTGSRNLVPNGDFGAGAAGWSSYGIETGWGNLPWLYGRVRTGPGPGPRRFLSIPVGGASSPTLYFDYLHPVATRQTRLLAANLGWIPVEPDRPYTLSCWMRADHAGVRAALGFVAEDADRGPWEQRRGQKTVTLDTGWRRVSYTFSVPRRNVFVLAGPDLEQDAPAVVDIAQVQLEPGDRMTEYAPRSVVEVGIAPTRPGGIFTVGQRPELTVTAANHGDAAETVEIRLRAQDYFDRAIPLPGVRLAIPAGSVSERRVSLPTSWRGYYRVHAEYRSGARTESCDIRVAVVPPRSGSDTVLGINHGFPSDELIRLASLAGVTWYRDWSLKWQDMEPTPGEYRWGVAETQIDRILRLGPRVQALLPPFPSADWCSEAPPGLPTTGYPGERLRQAWAPKDPALLGEFTRQAVERLKGRVNVWEFLNEPLYTDYALPGRGYTQYGGKRYGVADYVALLRVAAAGMKRADPACRVIGGVASGPAYLTRELMDAGILDLVDILNLHIYPGARAPESFLPEMDALNAEMKRHGKPKPIWITEFSYYGADDLPRKPFVPGNDWAEQRLLASERECADYTVRFIAVMLATGVEKVFIHSGASGAVNQPNFECCLFAYGGAPRKALPALAVFTDLLGPKPRCVGRRKLAGEALAFAFETGKQSVTVAWNPAPDAETRVTPRAGSKALDAMGRALPAGPVRLTQSPVYILGGAGEGKAALDRLR